MSRSRQILSDYEDLKQIIETKIHLAKELFRTNGDFVYIDFQEVSNQEKIHQILKKIEDDEIQCKEQIDSIEELADQKLIGEFQLLSKIISDLREKVDILELTQKNHLNQIKDLKKQIDQACYSDNDYLVRNQDIKVSESTNMSNEMKEHVLDIAQRNFKKFVQNGKLSHIHNKGYSSLVLRNPRDQKSINFPLFDDSKVLGMVVKSVPDLDFDQDQDTDDEALQGSQIQCQNSYKSAMREFMGMPLHLSKSMLRNSEVQERVSKPENFQGANGKSNKKKLMLTVLTGKNDFELIEDDSTPIFGIGGLMLKEFKENQS